MGLPRRPRVDYRGYAVAVHRRLCYPHGTSAAVIQFIYFEDLLLPWEGYMLVHEYHENH
jgi:hypothetical protein